MGCFCHASVAPLGSLIGSLEASGMISLSANVGVSAMAGANITAARSAAVRALVQLRLPTFPPAQATMMAQLTAMFSAMASLKLALGLPSLPALPQSSPRWCRRG